MARLRDWSAVTALVAAAASMAVLGIGTARATDQGITGKKLLLKSSKFVLLSKDPSIGIAGSDPVGGADSSISFSNGGAPVSLALPATLWSANGGATVFKYKNHDAPSGPSVVKVSKVAGGLLKAVGKGASLTVPNGAASINVVFSLDGGNNTYCMTFSGTGDGNKFLVKDAPAGTCPSGGAVCGNNVRQDTEVCDGADATACPGLCQGDCTCPPPVCGNGVREGTEACDGIDDATCPGTCRTDCTCAPACPATDVQVCLNIPQPPAPCGTCAFSVVLDECLASNTCESGNPHTQNCAAYIRANCASECCPPQCGNNVREGSEACDGTDDAACPGHCHDCGCVVCGDNVREGTEACDGTDDSACPGLCQADCACMESGCSADDRQVCLNIPQPPNPCFTCASSIIFGECLLSNMCESGNPHTQNCAAYIRAHCSSECCP